MYHNVAVPGIELSVSQSSVSRTRCHCHCVSHSSDSLTQSERCSHTYQVPVTAILQYFSVKFTLIFSVVNL